MLLAAISAIAGSGKKTLSATGATTTTQATALAPSTTAAGQTTTTPATSPPTTVPPTTAPPPTAAPAPDVVPTQTFSGTSNQATKSFTVSSGLTAFKARFKGSSNFAVELIDLSGQTTAVLFNQIGNYSGSTGESLPAGAYVMKVTGVGSWTITVDQPRPNVGAPLSQTYSGTSEALVGPFTGADGSTRLQFHFAGSHNFAVEVLGNDGQLVDVSANQIGSYDGSTVVQTSASSLYWLKVTGNGSWRIQVGS